MRINPFLSYNFYNRGKFRENAMVNNTQNVVDDLSLEYLEGISNEPERAVVKPFEQRQDDALLLNNLESLDDDGVIPGISVLPQSDNATEIVSKSDTVDQEPDFLEASEVRLNDLIDKFLADSVRPVIIICDDKVKYVNQTVRELLGVSDDSIVEHNFLDFVKRDDWNLLAENIGVMLTDAKKVSIRLQAADDKIVETILEAMYIPDDNHFAFILIGNQIKKDTDAKTSLNASGIGLYDQVTGLPSFYLFEDRVRVAVNHETYKENALQKNMIAVMAISIDNIFSLKQLGMADFVLKKLASKLVFSLKKSYTVARGIKSQFWILMSDLQDVSDLDVELHKIKAIFDEGVEDNFARHEISCSIGVSVFPVVARSGKKLIDQAIVAVKTAQNSGGGINFYSEDKQSEN